MDDFSGGNLGVDSVQKADELLMTVPLHVAADDGSVEHVEGGEQGRGAMALVVVVIVPARPFFMGRLGWPGRASGFGFSRQTTGRWRRRADRHKAPLRRAISRRSWDRWRA